jgi:hypothetical protein
MLLPLLIELALQLLVSPDFATLIPDKYTSLYAVAIIVVNFYLRTITTTSIGERR